ncbi:MAG: sigma-70 family RNA polymerase sigma factor [candidate division FCPU426 bacterium]
MDKEQKAEARERDRLLVERITKGDESALDELMAHWSRPVYSLALRILGNPSQAEEVTQDVFFKAWKSAAVFEDKRGAFSSWILTMTHHAAIDSMRRSRTRGSAVTTLLDTQNPVVASSFAAPRNGISTWQKMKLDQALASLPQKQKEVVEMAYFDGYTREEMAKILKEPVGTVKTRLRDAILKLSNVFKDPEAALQSNKEFRT